MTSSVANGQTKRTGYCLNDGETEVTLSGKCMRCGKLAMNVITQEALDTARYKADPPEVIDSVKSSFGREAAIPAVSTPAVSTPAAPTPAPIAQVEEIAKADDVIILPDNQLSKRWIQNTLALIKSLSETKSRQEAAIKAERKNIQRIDKAINTLKAQLAVYRIDDEHSVKASQPWAKDYTCCIQCGTDTIKHKSLGRCVNCDGTMRRDKGKIA